MARFVIFTMPVKNLLMVATDRISAFDFILPDEIPFKGGVLNRISAFWFDKFADIVPNHLVSIDPADFPEEFAEYRDYLAGRAMLVKKAQTIPIECIVRGYLTGSGKKTYDENGTVCGIQLPEGLTEASSFPSRCSRRPRRPRSATTTRTSRSSVAARSWARTSPRRFVTCPQRFTRLLPSMPRPVASSSPTPSSSSVSSMQGYADRRVPHARLQPFLACRQLRGGARFSPATTSNSSAIGSRPTGI